MHRVALKIGLVAAVAAGVTGSLVAGLSAVPWAYGALTAVVAGTAAYAAAAHYLGDRLEHVASVLNDLIREGGRGDGSATHQGDEVDRLVRRSDQALHAVRKRVAEQNRTENFRRDYVGDVSHEIKTPVFAIQGFAETLLNGALDDLTVSRSFVEKIFHHANRLDSLAADLSEISRLETGALKLAMAPFELRSVLEEVCESLDVAARQKDIEVRVVVDDDIRMRGDRERICQVLTNLVDNAIKYTDSGGWVEVRAMREPSGDILFSVQDNGLGLAPDEIERVTERFYRAEKSRSRNQGGTGLGLSIVKHILAAHGASLRIESHVGEGSVFSFTLPTEPGRAEPE